MDIINIIKEVLIKLNIEGFIVGGYLRDGYLNEKSKDLDITLSDKIEDFVEILKDKGIVFFLLNASEKIYRVDYKKYILDITIIRGKNIYEDLKKRDFSMNSIAMSLKDDKIIDPQNGIADIENKILRVNSKERIREDPIRILRGIRFILKYGFLIDQNTKDSFKEFACKINECKKERKFIELMKIIEEDRDAACFSIMDELGVLECIILYSKENKSLGNCKHHFEDDFNHSIMTYKAFNSFLKGQIGLEIHAEGLYKDNISFFSLKHYQSLATFICGIEKYICYNKKDNKISFYDHQIKGGGDINSFLHDYGFPKKAEKFISNLVLGYMEPPILFKNRGGKNHYLKFFRKYQDYAPYIIILSFCDIYAARLCHDPDDEIVSYRIFMENLYAEFIKYKNIIRNPVISAEDLITATGLEGRKIQEAIDLINERTYLGEVKDRYQALNFIKSGVRYE